MDPREIKEPAGRSLGRVVTKAILAAAIVLPLLALKSCAEALGPYPGDRATDWTLFLFGSSLVAGLVAFVFVLIGRERRLSAIALGLNAAGVVANVAYFLTHFTYTRGR